MVCQLDELEGCKTKNELRSALASLPSGLDETYERALSSIVPKHKDNALRILQWLIFSSRPVQVDEVAEIFAANPDNDSKFEEGDRLQDPDEIIAYCGTLFTTQESGEGRRKKKIKELRLAHFSVKEYLVSERILRRCPQYSIGEIDAHLSIAGTCLTYLLHVVNLPSLPDHIFNEYPLLRYAVKNWRFHVSESELALSLRGIDWRVIRFLGNRKHCARWAKMNEPGFDPMEPYITLLSSIYVQPHTYSYPQEPTPMRHAINYMSLHYRLPHAKGIRPLSISYLLPELMST